MKYVRLFSTLAEYQAAKRGLVLPNVSLCSDIMHVEYNPYKEGGVIDVGWYYYSDGTYSSALNPFKTPIGICVIPPDMLPDGKARIMSLVNMDCSNPDNGSTGATTMMWGQYGKDTSLTNLTSVVISRGDPNDTIGSYSYGYLPSDVFNPNQYGSNINTFDSGTCWSSSEENPSYLAPSPYNNDGSFNLVYSNTTVTTANCLSDFNGVSNTDYLVTLHTIEDWTTSPTITNYSGTAAMPPAVCCRRFNGGGKQGDWYLPSIGELGFVMVRLKKINQALQTIITHDPTKAAVLGGWLWSSSEYNTNHARTLSLSNGYVYDYLKNTNLRVRAFLALNL